MFRETGCTVWGRKYAGPERLLSKDSSMYDRFREFHVSLREGKARGFGRRLLDLEAFRLCSGFRV